MLQNKGFTLIELLVVIAIIGILSSVIFTWLTNAKQNSEDTAVKNGLNQARTQADLYYNVNGIYTGICSTIKDASDPKGINRMIFSSGKSSGYNDSVTVNGVGSSQVRCNDASNGWAAEVPLKRVAGYYCVDYNRAGIVTTNSIGEAPGYAYCR